MEKRIDPCSSSPCKVHGDECPSVTYRGAFRLRPDGSVTEPVVEVLEHFSRGLVVYPLPLRLDLASHSPSGFAWGYNGSGPAQLVLALAAHATGDDRLALLVYSGIGSLVSRFPWAGVDEPKAPVWTLSREQVLEAVDVARAWLEGSAA